MSNELIVKLKELIDNLFIPDGVRAALVMALYSTLVVVAVFAYLNHYTKKGYFSLWTVSWLYYGFWLAACIGLDQSPDQPLLVMARLACIGTSALCMYWGSFELTECGRSRRELGMGLMMIVLWSYVAAYHVRDIIWITVPVFVLLASASLFTGLLYWRQRTTYRGANLLAAGFILWGIQLIGYPLQPFLTARGLALSYFSSAVLALFIALGMIVRVLEEARERAETLLGEFRKGVAARRELEQEITVSGQKYRALFDSASDAIFLVDLETLEIAEANESACRLVQYPGANQAHRSFLDFCPILRCDGTSLLEHKRAFDAVFCPSNDFHMARSNGESVLCEGSVNLVQDNQRSVLQINVREITERKRLEQQLRQAEKLSALGQLTAGVAHELNNPLAVVMGYAQLLTRKNGAETPAKNELIKILHESERAAKIVRNLLTFARPREPQMMPVDINYLVLTFLETHEADLLENGITLVKRLAPNLPKTMADPHQIEQVLTNLFVNAVQAMAASEGSRRLEFMTENCGKFLRLTVADSGPGIPPEIVGKIFDPFFTTKPPGQGTGLGLSISHSVVEEHGGRVWVESERGKGAKFMIELPLVAQPIEPDVASPALGRFASSASAAQYRVLVVDDEPGIVEVLKTILGDAGYTVETASDGEEGLKRIEAANFDLIISDLCMPGMDGETLYRSVRNCRPELAERFIFITGDTVSTRSRAFLEWTGNRWFSKPFNISEIEEVAANFLREESPLETVAVGRP